MMNVQYVGLWLYTVCTKSKVCAIKYPILYLHFIHKDVQAIQFLAKVEKRKTNKKKSFGLRVSKQC